MLLSFVTTTPSLSPSNNHCGRAVDGGVVCVLGLKYRHFTFELSLQCLVSVRAMNLFTIRAENIAFF